MEVCKTLTFLEGDQSIPSMYATKQLFDLRTDSVSLKTKCAASICFGGSVCSLSRARVDDGRVIGRQVLLPDDACVRPDAGVHDEVVDHHGPRGVGWQVVVELWGHGAQLQWKGI